MSRITDRDRVNSVRGLACLLLVFFHSATGAFKVGGTVDPVLNAALASLFPIRMPLFSMLSGFIYALRPIKEGAVGEFTRGKLRRLILPYMLVMTLLLTLEAGLGRSAEHELGELPYYLVFPFEHLWFLMSLFWVFLSYAGLDYFSGQRRLQISVAILVASIALFMMVPRSFDLFSIGRAFYLLPFFSAGVLIHRVLPAIERHIVYIVPLLAVTATAFFVLNLAMLQPELGGLTRDTPQALALGLTGCAFLLMAFPRLSLLSWVGRFSFAIYLFHTVFASLANRLTQDIYLLTLLSLVLGLSGPILIDRLIHRRLPVLLPLIGEQRKPKAIAA